jgi:hypothetical protein
LASSGANEFEYCTAAIYISVISNINFLCGPNGINEVLTAANNVIYIDYNDIGDEVSFIDSLAVTSSSNTLCPAI